MIAVVADPDIVAHVSATTGLDTASAARLVDDVVAFHAEDLKGYVRRRHAELKLRGHHNDAIFASINEELSARVVAAPRLSARQLRRIVYG